jgi:hypothetical protein
MYCGARQAESIERRSATARSTLDLACNNSKTVSDGAAALSDFRSRGAKTYDWFSCSLPAALIFVFIHGGICRSA